MLLITTLKALSREFCTYMPWEIIYADDLVVITDSLEECIAKLKAWNETVTWNARV